MHAHIIVATHAYVIYIIIYRNSYIFTHPYLQGKLGKMSYYLNIKLKIKIKYIFPLHMHFSV